MGEALGRYTLYRRIGVGGMAEVFLAREAVEGGGHRLCVVKRAHAFLSSDLTAIRMFLDEAQLVAQLNHPHIVQIFDLGSVGDVFYTAMEYVPGFDLLTVIQEHERQGESISEGVAARLVSQAALALDHAHNAVGQNGQPLEIIHRDVSPQNILLSTAGVVKLIDFGVAKATIAKHATQTGIVKGKYPYMSPEQISGKPLDRRTDVYALGLVFYELLTNTRAIAGDHEPQIIENAGRGRITPAQSHRPNLSEGLRRILARCLDPIREGRYETCAELSSDLERHLVEHRQKVTAADCARLLQMVGSDPEVSIDELEADQQANAPADEVSGVDATAVRSSPSHQRRTESAMPSYGNAKAAAPIPLVAEVMRGGAAATPIPLVAEVARGGAAAPQAVATPFGGSSAIGPIPLTNEARRPSRTEPNLEHVTQQATPVQRETLAAAADRPTAPAVSPPPVPLPRRSGRAWLIVAVVGLAALLVAVVALTFLKKQSPTVSPVAEAVPEPNTKSPSTPDPATGPSVAPQPDPNQKPGADAAVEPTVPAPAVPDAPTAPQPVEAKPAPVEAAPAHLKVESAPEMDVWVDGKKRGRTPQELSLPAGTHQLEWKDAANGLARTLKVKLLAAQRRTESWAPKKGTLVIEVVPFGAISVDGKSQGVSSFKSVEVWEGRHTVRVVNDELKRTEERAVEVTPGAETKTTIKLM
jgi:serine/threonine-protein kinase